MNPLGRWSGSIVDYVECLSRPVATQPGHWAHCVGAPAAGAEFRGAPTPGTVATMTFEPRKAVVTASDSGIGRATAVALAHAGMDIGITWHSDSDGAEATAREGTQSG